MFARFTRLISTACAATLLAGAASAQSFPSRPIKILVGFAAGGATDLTARLYAAKLQDILKTPVVVENKPGAYEAIAAQALMSSPPDGYTLWLSTIASLALAPSIRSVPYDSLKSFSYIGRIGETEAVMVARKGFPAASFGELIGYAKSHPGQVNYGSAGIGMPNHLLMEYISQLTGAPMTHIPFKSDGDVAREIAGGTIDFAMGSPISLIPFVSDGKMNAIAVTGNERLKALPGTPALAESNIAALKGLSVYSFFGLVGPAGIPPEVVATLNEALNKASRMPDLAERLDALAVKLTPGTPNDFRQYVDKELKVWREVTKKVKL